MKFVFDEYALGGILTAACRAVLGSHGIAWSTTDGDTAGEAAADYLEAAFGRRAEAAEFVKSVESDLDALPTFEKRRSVGPTWFEPPV